MKKVSLLILLVASKSILAQKTEDQKAIKAMCGCFEVKFNFAETFKYPKDTANYKASAIKHDEALEWVELVEDNATKISMQHLLIVGKESIVKHWRQDWQFENTAFYDYNGFEDWNFLRKTKDQVKGQWTQKVFEVDDKPRYQGTASWIHTDNRTFWENTTNAPLPRREYTQRSDYNITQRMNDVEITKEGWIHNQDNDKIIRTKNQKDYILAQEKGYNTYTRVADSKCEDAKKWWKEKKDFWGKVRIKWEIEFAKNNYLKLIDELDGKPLYKHLQAMKIDAKQEEINTLIDRFIVSNY